MISFSSAGRYSLAWLIASISFCKRGQRAPGTYFAVRLGQSVEVLPELVDVVVVDLAQGGWVFEEHNLYLGGQRLLILVIFSSYRERLLQLDLKGKMQDCRGFLATTGRM